MQPCLACVKHGSVYEPIDRRSGIKRSFVTTGCILHPGPAAAQYHNDVPCRFSIFRKEGGILGVVMGIKVAAESFLTRFVGGMVDMLAHGLGWVLGKIGFKDVGEILKKFSFGDNVMKPFLDFFTSVGQKFSDGLDWIAEKWKSLKDSWTDFSWADVGDNAVYAAKLWSWKMDEAARDFLRRHLPDPNAKGEHWYSISNVKKILIPDGIYDYAYGKHPKPVKPNKHAVQAIYDEANSAEGKSKLKALHNTKAMDLAKQLRHLDKAAYDAWLKGKMQRNQKWSDENDRLQGTNFKAWKVGHELRQADELQMLTKQLNAARVRHHVAPPVVINNNTTNNNGGGSNLKPMPTPINIHSPAAVSPAP